MTREEAIARAYAAFNARDIDAVLDLMTDDVDWPNSMDNVRVFGKSAVRDYWTQQWTMIAPQVEPVTVQIESDGRVDVEVRQVVHDLAGSLLMDEIVHHVYTFVDGLIRKMDIQPAAPA